MEDESMVTVTEKELFSSSDYKLVPWSSWDQWNFVRESIFSSSPDSVSAGLRRISAWRSRGRLPMQIEVTAPFIEIQQQDPFFRKDLSDNTLVSEEMLAMLYSIAIIRLVNEFPEDTHKKTGISITNLSEAIGIPRVVIDVRHESTHRNLPSLKLARSASIKAVDWLKSNYWDPQKNAIPDVCEEIRSKLCEVIDYIKAKEIKLKRSRRSLLSSQIVNQSKSTGLGKQMSRIIKSIVQLYSSNPSQVVSVLLEFIQMDGSDLLDHGDVAEPDESDSDGLKPSNVSFHHLKIIITALLNKEPRFVLGLLKSVLQIIESDQDFKSGCNNNGSKLNLSSLLLWLITTLKLLTETGNINIINEINIPCDESNSVPSFSPKKLLEKCLNLSLFGDKNIASSALMLVDMVGNNTVKEKVKKLVFLGSGEIKSASTLSTHDKSFEKAAEKFNYLKNKRNNNNIENNNKWSLAKSWTPCPIGMVPCSYSSTPILPSLDLVSNEIKSLESENKKNENNKRVCCVNNEENENERVVVKKQNQNLEQNLIESSGLESKSKVKFPMENVLLIDGAWRELSDDELAAFKNGVRIFV